MTDDEFYSQPKYSKSYNKSSGVWNYESGFAETNAAYLSDEDRQGIVEHARRLIQDKSLPEDHVAYCLGVLAAIELKVIEELEMETGEPVD